LAKKGAVATLRRRADRRKKKKKELKQMKKVMMSVKTVGRVLKRKRA